MTYKAIVKFSYTSDNQDPPSKWFPESVDCKTITVEAPAEDLNIHQYYELFKNFLGAAGFCEYSIMDGACRVAFNDSNSQEQMKKVADEYDIFLAEEYHEKLVEYDKQQDEEIKKLEAEIKELKAKLAEVLPEKYGKGGIGGEGDPMFMGQFKPWNDLVPGSDEAYKKGCKCPILDNQNMPEGKKWVSAECPLHGS
jgi:hypothetical protein